MHGLLGVGALFFAECGNKELVEMEGDESGECSDLSDNDSNGQTDCDDARAVEMRDR